MFRHNWPTTRFLPTSTVSVWSSNAIVILIMFSTSRMTMSTWLAERREGFSLAGKGNIDAQRQCTEGKESHETCDWHSSCEDLYKRASPHLHRHKQRRNHQELQQKAHNISRHYEQQVSIFKISAFCLFLFSLKSLKINFFLGFLFWFFFTSSKT